MSESAFKIHCVKCTPVFKVFLVRIGPYCYWTKKTSNTDTFQAGANSELPALISQILFSYSFLKRLTRARKLAREQLIQGIHPAFKIQFNSSISWTIPH